MLVILILASITLPQFNAMMRAVRLKGAVSDFASLVQMQRLRAVADDRYYSTYLLPGAANNPQRAFVDIYPQNNNGSSGTQGTTYTCNANGCDPIAAISSEIVGQPSANAPSTAALKASVLPANSPVAMTDGSSAATPVTFGPRGLPCTPSPVVGGTVCDSLGGPTAYWFFFQDRLSRNWGAVTITPAGRIQRWLFAGGANGAWASY